jgi:uncharacterized membrane protein YkoI
MKIQIACALASAALLVGCTTSEEEYAGSQSAPNIGTKFSELPPAVQASIRSRAPNARIDDIDKETRSGRTIYEISFAEPGLNPKMHIAENGNVVQVGDTIVESAGATTHVGAELGDLPLPVQRTIMQRSPRAAIEDIDKETRSGRTIYEVTFQDSENNPRLHIAEDGTIVRGVE